MRQDNFLIKKQREREERKKRSMLEKLMNSPTNLQRGTNMNESKRSKRTTSKQNTFSKGRTLN